MRIRSSKVHAKLDMFDELPTAHSTVVLDIGDVGCQMPDAQ